MMSSYNQTMPGVIQRPTSNVSAAPQPTPAGGQGDAGQQQQMLMMLLALLAASQGQGGAGMPQAAPQPGLSMLPMRQ